MLTRRMEKNRSQKAKEVRLIALFDYFMDGGDDTQCPFIDFEDDCINLCGRHFEVCVGVLIQGSDYCICPCRKYGHHNAMKQLKSLLVREGYIK